MLTDNFQLSHFSLNYLSDAWQIKRAAGSLEPSQLETLQLHCIAVAGASLPSPLALEIELQDGAIRIGHERLSSACDMQVDASACPLFRLSFSADPRKQDSVWFLAGRILPVSGASNFRDFGGYATQSGRQVVWGRLFRAGHLADLTEQDHGVLTQQRVAQVCDFRRADEVTRQPSQLPGGTTISPIAISPGSSSGFVEQFSVQELDEQQVDEFMMEINADLALNHADRYRLMFDQLLSASDGVLIHCSAGKDRTGFGAALILSALGVSRELIVEDYLLTNSCVDIDREIARWTQNWQLDGDQSLNRDALKVILGVKKSYLSAAFNAIDQQYDGIDQYLSSAVGLTDAEKDELCYRFIY